MTGKIGRRLRKVMLSLISGSGGVVISLGCPCFCITDCSVPNLRSNVFFSSNTELGIYEGPYQVPMPPFPPFCLVPAPFHILSLFSGDGILHIIMNSRRS